MSIPISSKRRRSQRGHSMIEGALTLPAFLLLTLGAMDFSWGVYAYNFCAYAAQDASRWASVHGSLSSSPASYDSVKNYVTAEAIGLTRSQLTVSPCWSGTCLTSGSPASGTNEPGDTVSVKVTYQIKPLFALGFKQAFNVQSTGQYVINR